MGNTTRAQFSAWSLKLKARQGFGNAFITSQEPHSYQTFCINTDLKLHQNHSIINIMTKMRMNVKILKHTYRQIYNQREIPSFEWRCHKWDEGDEWAKSSARERRKESNPERRKEVLAGEGDGQGGTARNSECKFNQKDVPCKTV